MPSLLAVTTHYADVLKIGQSVKKNFFIIWKLYSFFPAFEADSDFEEESYKKIHDEYKNLVDFMLGSYMEDIGITPEQFEAHCGKASKNIKSEFHQVCKSYRWKIWNQHVVLQKGSKNA